MTDSLFSLGPFDLNLWNVIFLIFLFYIAYRGRKVVHGILNKYVRKTEIRIQGKRLAWLKFLSQSIYLLAFYIAILSLRINNPGVGFDDLLNYPIIQFSSIKIAFYHIIVIITVLFSARIAVFFSRLYIARKLKDNPKYNEGNLYIYTQLAKYVIYVFSILFCFQALDIPLTNLLFGSAAVLVGIGLGLQDAFKDLIAGFILLLEGNLKVGDIIRISSTENHENLVAKIKKINIRTTQIQTWEGNVLVIPNSILTRDQVENWSHSSRLTRFTIKVSVAYGTDTDLVKKLLETAALSHPKVKRTQQILVRLSNFGDNGLELELIFWADQHWDIKTYKSEIRFEIDRLFRANDIRIPFPQRTVHLPKKD
ncbi:MAG: mechanosensitive ion channel family protein [Crocinitomicaceae bacterium]